MHEAVDSKNGRSPVVLINPPDPLPAYVYPTNRPPYDLLYIQSFLHQHHIGTVYLDLHNKKIGRDKYLPLLAKTNAFYYVINTTGHHHDFRSYRARRRHKKRDTIVQQIIQEITSVCADRLIILVGETARVYSDEYADCGADCILFDEPEYTLLEILEKKAKTPAPFEGIKGVSYNVGDRFVRNRSRNAMHTLDELPPPRWELLGGYFWDSVFRERREYIDLMGMRGCPHACTFCKSSLSKKVFYHSPGYLLAQIELLHRRFGYTDFFFRDAGYFEDRRRAEEMCRGLKELRGITWKCNARVDCIDRTLLKLMKSSGCSLIAYGAESGNQRTLDAVRKGTSLRIIVNTFAVTKKEGIKVSAYFILGMPSEGLAAQLRTVFFAAKSGADILYFTKYFSISSGSDNKKIKEYLMRVIVVAVLETVSLFLNRKRVYYSKIRMGMFLSAGNTDIA